MPLQKQTPTKIKDPKHPGINKNKVTKKGQKSVKYVLR
jgi:hypothetical protein